MSNVVVREKYMPPEGAPPSETPIAEQTLDAFPKVRDHYAERDVLAKLEAPPVVITGEARREWNRDEAQAEYAGHGMVAQAFAEADKREKARRETPWWDKTPMTPDPAAHPYPEAAEPGVGGGGAFAEEAAPVAEIAPEPAPDPGAALAKLAQMAGQQQAEDEPADATKVIPAAEEETQIVPAVEDGGDGDG